MNTLGIIASCVGVAGFLALGIANRNTWLAIIAVIGGLLSVSVLGMNLW